MAKEKLRSLFNTYQVLSNILCLSMHALVLFIATLGIRQYHAQFAVEMLKCEQMTFLNVAKQVKKAFLELELRFPLWEDRNYVINHDSDGPHQAMQCMV